MGKIDLGTTESFGTNKDSIVIRHYVAGIKGGVVLDVDGFEGDKIAAGHIIIQTTDEYETYKPLNVSNGNYVALPSNHQYVGVAVATVEKDEPIVGVMYSGEVNDKACPCPMGASLIAALKTAVPTLVFKHD